MPDIIRLACEIDVGMARHVASARVRAMMTKGARIKGPRVLIEGLTFKEKCPDTRNTKMIDLVKGLADDGITRNTRDDWADPHEVQDKYGIALTANIPVGAQYDAVMPIKRDQAVARGTTAACWPRTGCFLT